MKNTSEVIPRSNPSSPETMKNKLRLSLVIAFYFAGNTTVFQPIQTKKASYWASFIRVTGQNETSVNSPVSFTKIYRKTMKWRYRREGGTILVCLLVSV
jgi:hypothetical protein